MIRTTSVAAALTVVVLTAASPCPAAAAEQRRAEQIAAQVDELERRLEVLTEELRKLKEAQAIPETTELESAHGHAPAASKVYARDRGLSIGGYGEFNLNETVADTGGDSDDVFDFLRAVLYFGYKFNDRIVFNSELEFEHASTDTDDGSVSVEFAYLDFLLHERANLRAGLLLVPVGFLNELHEPPFYHGNDRPAVERQIIPTTWRANGLGVFGELAEGLRYRTYVVTSLRADKFRSSNLRGARQKGGNEQANDFSWVGRLDYSPTPGLDFGFSAYLGDQGQDADFATAVDGMGEPTATVKTDAFMQMYEAHAQWHYRGLELRALGVLVDIDDADVLSLDNALTDNGQGTVAERMIGYYGEIAYDIMPLIDPDSEQYLAPWFRYSVYDTQDDVPTGFAADESEDRDAIELGVSYKPIPRVVIKLDYRNQKAKAGEEPDEVRFGAGFVF